MGTRPRTRLGDNYESLGNKENTEPLRPRSAFSVACTATLCRPLRIFQFLTILLLFALVIFMTAKSATAKPIHISHPASILLIILTASYLFFIAIDMISQFGGHGLPDSPMFLFSFLGVVLFAIAGGLMVHYRNPEDHLWALLLSQILCFIVSILFLIEITMLIGYWRQRCLSWKRCYPYTPAGTCGQREMKTIFTRDGPRDVDIELGRCDLATSVSRCGIPLETSADSAVEEHGCRKIGIGHRRQYVDCHSSVPALAIVQIAQIQTETGPTSITESQTARTEMIESIVQTTSRCELCNRQMEAAPPTLCVSSPSPSSMSQSRYPSQIQTQLPQLQAPQLPVETTPYNVPQSPSPSPQVQLGNCALCPAFYHMVRGGIPISANPCCQSCSCGVKTPEQSRQVVPYLLDQSSQRLQSDWPQRQASTATMTKAPTENDSDTATPVTTERSEIEHLVVDETDRYRPIRKLPRVYETRPCPTHGAGLAARMAGLPETVTKVTLPSICIRRNKRTQTPAKKSPQIEGEADKTKEDPVDPRSSLDKPDRYKSEDSKVSATSIRSGRNELTNRTLSDVRVRMLSDEEMRRRSRVSRTSGYASPIKRFRDSEILLEETELELPEETNRDIDGMSKTSMTKTESSGKLIWQSDRSEPRISVPMGKEVTWLRENFAIKEEPDVGWDVEESRESSERIQGESRIKFRGESNTPEGSEVSLRDDEPSDSGSSRIVKKGSRKISRTSSQAGRQRSRTGSTSGSRLRLEKSGEDTKESKRRMGESSGSIPRSRSRSRSGMRPSTAASEVPSVPTSRNVSKYGLSKAGSEISAPSRSRSRTEERLSKEDSEIPSNSKARLSKNDSEISSRSITRSSKEQRSTVDSDTPLESKGRLSREDSEISSRSLIRDSKDRQSRIDSDMPDSKVQLSKKSSEISSGSMTRSSKEQRSKTDADMQLQSRGRLSREDSETSSRSMIRDSKDRQSRIDSDMPGSEVQLSREYSEISSGSIIKSGSKDQPSRGDIKIPSGSKTSTKESELRLERSVEDYGSSRGSLTREDSEISSGSMIERLSRADGSETPSESRTVIEEQLLRLEKPEDRAGSQRRVGESDLSIPPTRSQSGSTSRGLAGETRSSTPSGSTVRKDDFSEPSIGKRRSETGSAVVGSPGSKTSAISQERSVRKIEEDISSYTDWPAGQRKFSDRETPSSSREFIEKSEDDHSRDIEGWREELDEELEADESLIFASSSKVSRTKPRKERSSRMVKSDRGDDVRETPGRISTQQNIAGRSAERSPDASRSGSRGRLSRKQKGASSTREFAYAPAPWSSKGNVLQSRSRIEPQSRIEFDQTGIPDCDPYTGMETGLPVPDCPPTWQCIENPECTISGVAMDYDCPPSVCTHESTCVDPCSCRLKSILLHQGSISPRRQPVRCLTTEQPAIINCDTGAPRRQCPMRELRCNRGMLAWAARRKQQPPGEDRIARSSDTDRRITFNLCYVS